MRTDKERLIGFSAMIAALIGSLCCLGPVALALLGLGGASLFVSLGVLRPLFIILTLALIGYAFYRVHQKEKFGCEPGELCYTPQGIKKVKTFLYFVTVLSVLVLSFVYWFPILVK